MGAMPLMKKLLCLQNDIKVPKSQYNSFGKYNFRSCEDILETVKPLCIEYNVLLHLTDKVINVGDNNYIEATATLYDLDSESSISTSASAREAKEKKGMDDSQISGTASSYARKYALGGLLALDDTKDADTEEYHRRTTKPAKAAASKAAVEPTTEAKLVCADCGAPFTEYIDRNGKWWSAEEIYEMAKKRNADGKARCAKCRKKKEEESK